MANAVHEMRVRPDVRSHQKRCKLEIDGVDESDACQSGVRDNHDGNPRGGHEQPGDGLAFHVGVVRWP